MNRKDFQDLSRIRLLEAKALMASSRYNGAYYLAGYSVECALKACFAKSVQRYDFPDKKKTNEVHAHDPLTLIKVANLEPLLKFEVANDQEFAKRWAIAKNWSEQSRYNPHVKPDEAKEMIEAIANVRHGVIPWIKRHW